MATVVAFVLLVMPMMATAAPVQLEAELGSRVRQAAPADIPSGLPTADAARVTLVAFGQCVAQRNRKGAERALALYLHDKAGEAALTRLATPECLRGGELRMATDLMRGALFMALYQIDFGKLKSAPALQAEPLDYVKDGGDPTDPAVRVYVAARIFAECVVRAAPEPSRDILLASVASKREAQDFQVLLPQFGACIARGAQVKFSKIVLTGLIAEVLYRLSIRADTVAGKP